MVASKAFSLPLVWLLGSSLLQGASDGLVVDAQHAKAWHGLRYLFWRSMVLGVPVCWVGSTLYFLGGQQVHPLRHLYVEMTYF